MKEITRDLNEKEGVDIEDPYYLARPFIREIISSNRNISLLDDYIKIPTFEEEIPDFTDCDFAAREPDGDWIAVAHEGGPVRGFSEMMPAFRGALNIEQLERVMAHIRTFCTDTSWPRGELNFPRALLTEKAYPEDEWVIEAEAAVEGEGSVGSAFVYERRFGPRSQIEVRIPYGWRHQRQERDPC